MDFSRFLTNSEICRTCLKQKGETTHFTSVDALQSDPKEATIKQKLLRCVPQMDLSVTPNAVICTNCLKAINFVLGFTNVWMQTEKDIQNYVQKVGSTDVNLFDVIQEGKHVKDPDDLIQEQVEQVPDNLVLVDEQVKQDPDNLIQEDDPFEQIHDKIYIKNEPLDEYEHANNLNGTEQEEKNFELVEIKNEEKVTETQSTSLPVGTNEEENADFICKTAISKAELVSHLKVHVKQPKEQVTRDAPRYRCGLCNYKTNLQRCLIVHIKLHKENKLLKCTRCEYVCVKPGRLHAHMKTHTNCKYQCPQCDYSCARKPDFVAHTTSHTGDQPYNCSQCEYSTNFKSSLVRHIRIHTGDKPYKCTVCSYRARTQGTFKAHMRTHTGDKPYKCTQCGYSSATRSALVVHNISHTGDRPYNCAQCEYSTTSKFALVEHIRTHTGDKPYECALCSYCTSRRTSLIRHMKTHTADKAAK